MASYTRYEETTPRVVYEVPCYNGYAAHAEVLKALHAARTELVEAGVKICDNTIKVSPSDESIKIWYEKSTTRGNA